MDIRIGTGSIIKGLFLGGSTVKAVYVGSDKVYTYLVPAPSVSFGLQSGGVVGTVRITTTFPTGTLMSKAYVLLYLCSGGFFRWTVTSLSSTVYITPPSVEPNHGSQFAGANTYYIEGSGTYLSICSGNTGKLFSGSTPFTAIQVYGLYNGVAGWQYNSPYLT